MNNDSNIKAHVILLLTSTYKKHHKYFTINSIASVKQNMQIAIYIVALI